MLLMFGTCLRGTSAYLSLILTFLFYFVSVVALFVWLFMLPSSVRSFLPATAMARTHLTGVTVVLVCSGAGITPAVSVAER